MTDQPPEWTLFPPASAVEFAIAFLEQQGYVVAKPGDPPPEVEYTIHDKLLTRMECLASDLKVIDGMTKKDGRLPASYIDHVLPAMRRYAERVFVALERGVPVRNAWDRS